MLSESNTCFVVEPLDLELTGAITWTRQDLNFVQKTEERGKRKEGSGVKQKPSSIMIHDLSFKIISIALWSKESFVVWLL